MRQMRQMQNAKSFSKRDFGFNHVVVKVNVPRDSHKSDSAVILNDI
jgi:hypothetical protein